MKKIRFAAYALVCVALLSACNMPVAPTTTPEEISSTLAVQTLQAMMTQVIQDSTETSQVTPLSQTSTPTPPNPAATGTGAPAVPSDTPTPPPPPCDAAGFVSDVTIPDGTTLTAGSSFTKTWRLKNTGVCTWTTNYAVVFVDGNAMGASSSIGLPASVPPGQTVDISITMTAPSATGTYQGNWKLRNAAGLVFGTGGSGSGNFYVQIKVQNPISTSGGYKFADNICAADWSNGSNSLACPNQDGNANGYAIKVNNPTLETGTVDNEAGLVMGPQQVTNGYISGKYPSLTVQNYDHFLAIVQCAYQASNCNVRFQLDYQVGSNAVQTLGYWDEVYDNKYHYVDVDLSSLAGQNVRLILTIKANSSPSGDRALWLAPRILNRAPTPTP